jgi:bifunctional DNase/RNase
VDAVEFKEVILKGIAMDEKSKMPLAVFSEKSGSRLLSLWIGPFEASAIIVEIEEVKPPRPLTHELLAQFMERHHFTLVDTRIYGAIEDKHLARITYRKGLRLYTMEVRPSDGIALALKAKAPILCSESLLKEESFSELIFQTAGGLTKDFIFLDTEEMDTNLMQSSDFHGVEVSAGSIDFSRPLFDNPLT